MERSAVDAIREELALLRASLLEDELAFDPADEIDAWASPDTSPPPSSLPPSLRIRLSSSDELLVTYAPPHGRPTCSLASLSSTSAAPPSSLVSLIEARLPSILAEQSPYPVFELYNALHEHAQDATRGCISPPRPTPPLPPASPTPASTKLVMLWAHHLLATSKRKDLVAWSAELSLLGAARPGYPGMMFALGEASEVDEFVRRIKRLQWYALQVRHDAVLEDDEATRAREAWQGGWREVESVGAMSTMMDEAGFKAVFLSAMKIGH